MFQVQRALSHDTSVAWVKHTEAPEMSTEITNIRQVLGSRTVQYLFLCSLVHLTTKFLPYLWELFGDTSENQVVQVPGLCQIFDIS